MVQKAVQQMLFDVDWAGDQGELDVLVIDMPPGTGDVQLSLGQLVLVDGEFTRNTMSNPQARSSSRRRRTLRSSTRARACPCSQRSTSP